MLVRVMVGMRAKIRLCSGQGRIGEVVPSVCRRDGLLVETLASRHGVAVGGDAQVDLHHLEIRGRQHSNGIAQRLWEAAHLTC